MKRRIARRRPARDQLGARGRVDAVVAGMGDGGEATRKWTSVAPARNSSPTSLRLVVPRTIESSTATTRRPRRICSTGLNFTRTESTRWSLPRPG